MAAVVPGSIIQIPIRLLPLLQPHTTEIGGVLLFDKGPDNTLILNTITSSLGRGASVNFSGLVNTFGEHPSWFVYHTHPPTHGDIYMGLSGQDLQLLLVFSLSTNQEISTVTHLLTTSTDIHITYITPDIYNIILRLYNGFIQGGPSEQRKIDFLNFYYILFNLLEVSFSRHNYLNSPYNPANGYTRDTHALNDLDTISFIPHHGRTWEYLMHLWANAAALLAGHPNEVHIQSIMATGGIPEVHQWMNTVALTIGLAKNPSEIEEGLFKTTSFRANALPSNGTNIILPCLDGGFIYNHTEEWVQAAPINPILGQIIPMFEGGRRQTKRATKKFRRKYKRNTRGGRRCI